MCRNRETNKFSGMLISLIIIMMYGLSVTVYSGYPGPGIILNSFLSLSAIVSVPLYIIFYNRKKQKAAETTVIFFTVVNSLYIFIAGEVWIIFKTDITFSVTFFILENAGILISDIKSVIFLISPFHLGFFLLISAAVIVFIFYTEKNGSWIDFIPDKVVYVFFIIPALVLIINSAAGTFVDISGKENEFHGINFSKYAKKKYAGEGHFRKRFGFNISGNPDIVVFILESVGADYADLKSTDVFGRSEHTLNIDNFFVPVPHTSNSIYSLITGNYSDYRVRQRLSRDDIMNSLPAVLKKTGYKSYFLYSGPVYFEDINYILDGAGFEVFDMEYFKTKTDPATGLPYNSFSWGVEDMAILNEIPSILAGKSYPVFLCIGFSSTHSPYFNPVPGKFNRYDNSTAEGRYRNCIEYELDVAAQIVKLMKGRNRNTIFIITGDHGESFGEYGYLRHGFSLYNTEIKVPFSMNHPLLSNVKTPDAGSILDIYPTLLDLLGIEQPVEVNGKSLFSYGYSLNLFLRSWKTGESRGMIHGNTKFLYNKNSDILYEMDIMDNIKSSISVSAEKNSFIRFLDKQY